MSAGLALHVLAAAMWVGGLFFAYAALRPSIDALDSATRLSLFFTVLRRFLLWGWVSAGVLLATGFAMAMVAFGGFASLPWHIRTMMALGVLSTVGYAYLHAIPWRRFARSIGEADWSAAEVRLRHLRFVLAGVLLATATAAVVGAGGRYFA